MQGLTHHNNTKKAQNIKIMIYRLKNCKIMKSQKIKLRKMDDKSQFRKLLSKGVFASLNFNTCNALKLDSSSF